MLKMLLDSDQFSPRLALVRRFDAVRVAGNSLLEVAQPEQRFEIR
jgi:hypothetical protein